MKKLTILDEGYMKLEQNMALALLEGHSIIQSAGFKMADAIRAYGTTEESKLLYEEADYINFKHDPVVEEVLGDYAIQKNIAESVKYIKKNNTFSLTESAALSSILNHYTCKLVESEDIAEKVTLFFGGKNNVELAEDFDSITVSEAGIVSAYDSFSVLLEKTQELSDAYNKGLLERDIFAMNEPANRLAMLYEASTILKQNKES